MVNILCFLKCVNHYHDILIKTTFYRDHKSFRINVTEGNPTNAQVFNEIRYERHERACLRRLSLNSDNSAKKVTQHRDRVTQQNSANPRPDKHSGSQLPAQTRAERG